MDCNSSKIQEPWDGNSSTGVLWQPQELCPLCSHSWQFTTATEWWPLLETGKQLIVPCHWWEQLLFIQLPVSIPCACNLAMLGICLVSLNSCAEAHMESIDGSIFELLLTDFCYLSCSHKEVCVCGEKNKIQACTLLIIWLFFFKHVQKSKIVWEFRPWFISHFKTWCFQANLARSQVLLNSTEYSLFPDNWDYSTFENI